MKVLEFIVKIFWDFPLKVIAKIFKGINTPQVEISPTSYRDAFQGLEEKALKKAWEIRNFEIELYWKRAAYFWAFIALTFGGYIAFLSSDNLNHQFPELEYLIICIGIIFSVAWLLVNTASKKWQENWEGHIDRLEDIVTGPIYKIVRNQQYNFSVSKINIYTSAFVLVVWIGMAIRYLILSITFKPNPGCHFAWIEIIASFVTILFIMLFIVKGRTGVGNDSVGYFRRNEH